MEPTVRGDRVRRRIVIVGAGVVGGAVGWRLAAAGHRVTLVDPTPGGLASPGSFAWLNASFAEDPIYNRLRHDSLELWRELKDADPGVPIEFRGALMWQQDHFDLDEVAESQTVLGRPAAMLDGDAVLDRHPAVRQAPDRALCLIGDGHGDPEAITAWFLAAACQAGAELVAGATVKRILLDDGRVTGVRTTTGDIEADRVIVCAGTSLPDVLRPLGLQVTMQNDAGLLARISPGTATIDTMLVAADVHLWQRPDGGYLAGADFAGGDFDDPDRNAAAVLDGLHSLIGGTDDCAVEEVTVRERPMPADGRPAIGPLGPAGFYVVSTHSGMTLAPVIAECVAAEVGEDCPDPRLAPYRPARAALQPRPAGPVPDGAESDR